MLEESKKILAPYAKSKRVQWTGTFLTLLSVVKAVGFAVNPWIALGVYAAGNIVTKVLDEKKQGD